MLSTEKMKQKTVASCNASEHINPFPGAYKKKDAKKMQLFNNRGQRTYVRACGDSQRTLRTVLPLTIYE